MLDKSVKVVRPKLFSMRKAILQLIILNASDHYTIKGSKCVCVNQACWLIEIKLIDHKHLLFRGSLTVSCV